MLLTEWGGTFLTTSYPLPTELILEFYNNITDEVFMLIILGLLFVLGTVEAFTNLECEVVYHSSYSAPADTLFVLQVTGGSEKNLVCKAEVL